MNQMWSRNVVEDSPVKARHDEMYMDHVPLLFTTYCQKFLNAPPICGFEFSWIL